MRGTARNERSAREAGKLRPGALRRILHVDLDPFFVSVERSLDPTLRGVPLVVGGGGGDEGLGPVAAASAEAREMGVRAGQPIATAQRLCPEAVVRPGDLATYARISDEVTAILLATSRRVERPSADEAYVDLTRDAPGAPNPVTAAENVKDQIQRRLGLDASLGLASSRLAARVASRWARPRGLLVVIPGYEPSFLAAQPVSALPDLAPFLQTQLEEAGFTTLASIAEADETALAAVVGAPAALRLREAARGLNEEPVAVTAPPTWVQEEAPIRDRRADAPALLDIVGALAERAGRRLRPFGLGAGALSVEVGRAASSTRREQELMPAVDDDATLASVARSLAEALLEPPQGIRTVSVRLRRLARTAEQSTLWRS